MIEIASLRVLRGNLAQRELQSVLDWAQAHHAQWSAKWRELNP